MKTAEKHLVSCAIGLSSALCAAWLLAPERHLPEEKLILLAASWCPRSTDLQHQVAENAELAKRILVLRVDMVDQEADCSAPVASVIERAPWFRVLDESWICQRLGRYAASLHQAHFVALPAWLDHGEPVALLERDAVLERRGLRQCPGPRLQLGGAPCVVAEPEDESPPASVHMVVERGEGIGF